MANWEYIQSDLTVVFTGHICVLGFIYLGFDSYN